MHRKISRIVRRSAGCLSLIFVISTASGQTEKKLDSLFTTLYKQGVLNGCVLIAEDGKPIYEKAFGYADFDLKKPLNSHTMFELASVSKQFTAMAIMQLHQQNKLSYEDSLRSYFPQLIYQDITIADLLHHTSGIPEFLGWDETMIDKTRINNNQDVLSALIKNAQPLPFQPGEQLSYSNTNYVLLALIVEKVSGMKFSDYMDQYIFKPLGMTTTKVYPQRSVKKKIDNYAFGYLYDPVKRKFVINDSIKANRYQYYFDGVAGPYGISSSIEDMLKWDQALYTEKLVSRQELELAYTPAKLNDGSTAAFTGLSYGFGWLILPAKDDTGRIYMHSGGYPGYMTIIVRYPDKNKTIIILTNIYNVISLYNLCGATENILFNKPFVLPGARPFQKAVNLDPAQLKAVEGTYAIKSAPQVKFTITTDASQTYAQLTGQGRAEIYPESALTFFYTVVAAKIEFIEDEKGAINKLILFQNGQEIEAFRE